MSANPRNFKAGERLFGEGEPSTSLFIIKKGVVSIRKRKGNASVEIAHIRSNEVVGELSFFDRLPRSASAIAASEVEAIEIDFLSLDGLYSNVPPYFKTIMAAVAARLRRANDSIRRLKTETVSDDDLAILQAAEGRGDSDEPPAAGSPAAVSPGKFDAISEIESILAGHNPKEDEEK